MLLEEEKEGEGRRQHGNLHLFLPDLRQEQALSLASSWAVRGSSEGENGRERSGGEGMRPFIWARNAQGVCGGGGVF
jgi:hypothetical protein